MWGVTIMLKILTSFLKQHTFIHRNEPQQKKTNYETWTVEHPIRLFLVSAVTAAE